MKKILYYIVLSCISFALALLIFARADQETIAPVVSVVTVEPGTTPSVQPSSAPETAEPTPEPTPVPTPEPTPEFFTLSVIGDCTLSSLNGGSDFEAKMQGDYSYPFRNTVDIFSADDFSIANLECTFSDRYLSSGRLFYFQGKSEYANILPQGGIDFVTTTNNHTDDFGTAGMEDTWASLDAIGMAYGKENEARIYTTESGLKIGIYCLFNYFLTNDDSVSKLQAGIASLKEQGAEYIICAFHFGNEGYYNIVSYQEKTAHAAIDAGADLVYGSHPHVLQPYEEYNGGYILYSMGNWSFGGNTNPRDRDTAIVQISVKRDVDGTVTNDALSIIPCCLSSSEGYNDYCPRPYREDEEGYTRVMQKLTGTWTGANLTINY